MLHFQTLVFISNKIYQILFAGLMALLFSVLCANPELRATIQGIQANEWVQQAVDIDIYKWEEVVRDTEFHGNNAGDCFREDVLGKAVDLIKPQQHVDMMVDHPAAKPTVENQENIGLISNNKTEQNADVPVCPNSAASLAAERFAKLHANHFMSMLSKSF